MKTPQRLAIALILAVAMVTVTGCVPGGNRPAGTAAVVRSGGIDSYSTLDYDIGTGLDDGLIVRLSVYLPDWVPQEVAGPEGAEVIMLKDPVSACVLTALQGRTDTLVLDLSDDELASRSVVEAYTGALEISPPSISLRGAGIARLVDFAVASISADNQAILGRGFTALEQYVLIIVQCPAEVDVFAFSDELIANALVVSVERD